MKSKELWEVEWAKLFHNYVSYVLLCTVLFYVTVTEFLCGIVDRVNPTLHKADTSPTLWQTYLQTTFAYTHEVPSRFTTHYPTKKTLQLISTFSLLVTVQHTTCSNSCLVLLKMGIMMPEICWESIDNKHLTVASCWFSLSLHNFLTMHGHRNPKPTLLTYILTLQMLNLLPSAICWHY